MNIHITRIFYTWLVFFMNIVLTTNVLSDACLDILSSSEKSLSAFLPYAPCVCSYSYRIDVMLSCYHVVVIYAGSLQRAQDQLAGSTKARQRGRLLDRCWRKGDLPSRSIYACSDKLPSSSRHRTINSTSVYATTNYEQCFQIGCFHAWLMYIYNIYLVYI